MFKTKVSKEVNSQLRNIVREISTKKRDKKEVPRIILDKIDVIQKKSIKRRNSDKKVSQEGEEDEILSRV